MIWFIFGMIGLLILILLSRIYVSFNLLYTDQEQYISLKIYLLRIRIIKKTYPLIPENITLPHTDPEFESLPSKLHHLLQSLKLFQQVFTFALKKLKLHKLYWVTKGGTGDAASTGMTAGSLWSVKGMAAGLIGNSLQLACKPKLQVIPDYQKLYFYSTLDSMVSIRIAQAIHIILKIIRLLFSFKPDKALSA